MKYSFHPEAEAEFNQAIDYYENCAEGLGYDFLYREADYVFLVSSGSQEYEEKSK
jgi:hypothetical protein